MFMRTVGLALSLMIALPVAAPARPQNLTHLKGHWEGHAIKDERTFALFVDFDQLADPKVAYVAYVDLNLHGVPFVPSVCGSSICVERRPQNGPVSTFKGKIAGGRFTGLFNGAGAMDARFELRRVSTAPFILREERVAFRNGHVALEGTVILPDGPGPFAAAVVTHGSDAENRASAGYRGQGVQFARHGVAALIYDKRGTGASTGDYTIASLEDLAQDALAGAAALKQRSDIRPSRIGIAGQSQGGWIAPLAATMSKEVAFVVALSSPGIGPMAQSIFHNANEMRAAGFSEADIARAQALRNRMYQRARTGKVDDDFLKDLEAASKEPWFEASKLPYPYPSELDEGTRKLLLFEPLPVWQKVRVPVLAVWGAKDIYLPAEESRKAVSAALAQARNERITLRVLPNLNHSLYFERDPGAAWDFPRGSAEFEKILKGWIGAHLAGR